MAEKTQNISTGMNNQPNGGNTAKPVASSAPASFAPFFRRRTLGRGRAPSPPTWACYEQIPLEFTDSEEGDDDDDDDEEEDDDDDDDIETDSEERSVSGVETKFKPAKARPDSPYAMDMDIDEPEHDNAHAGEVGELGGIDVDGNSKIYSAPDDSDANIDLDAKHARGSADDGHCADECGFPNVSETQKKQDKGKQRAVEVISPPNDNENPEEKSPKKRGGNTRSRKRRDRESNQVLRPILTIKKSEGFVWNQELFIPSYIKDRYIASTSPPSSNFASSTSSGVMGHDFNDNYEIEVVEIRVQGNELESILS